MVSANLQAKVRADCRRSLLKQLPRITPIDWKDFEEVLIKAGCQFDRQEGDHRIYKRDDLKRPIVLPMDNDLPVFIIRNNLRTLGISETNTLNCLRSINIER